MAVVSNSGFSRRALFGVSLGLFALTSISAGAADQIHQKTPIGELALLPLLLIGHVALRGGSLQQNFEGAGLNRLFGKPKSP